jgi:membrane protein implicated in regulation of membrane protease activity
MLKYAYRKSDKIKTNVDALVGMKGRVIEAINLEKNTGRVFVSGDDWRAESENGEVIQKDEQIEVKQVNSTILIVKQIEKGE